MAHLIIKALSWRAWRGLGAALGILLFLCLTAFSGQTALAAGVGSLVQNGGGQDAYVVILPTGMDPAERDAILERVLQGQAAAAAQGEDGAGFMERVSENLHKVKLTLAVSVANIHRMPEVLSAVTAALESPDNRFGPWLGALIVLGTLFAGAAVVEFGFRRLIWRSVLAPVLDQDGRFTDKMKRAFTWLLRELVALVVFWGAATVIFFMLHDEDGAARLIATGIIGTVVMVRVIALGARFALAPFEPARRLLPMSDKDARSTHYCIVVLVSTIAVLFEPAVLADDIGTVDPAARMTYGVIIGFVVVLMAIGILLHLRRVIAVLILAGGGAEGRPSAFRNWFSRNWHILASLAFFGVYCTTIYLRAAAGGGRFADTAFGTMALIVLTPLSIRALQILLRDYCAQRVEESDLPASAIRSAFEGALQRMVPVILLVCAFMILGFMWGINVFSLTSGSIGAVVIDAVIDIGTILVIAYFIWEIARAAIDQRLAEDAPGHEEGEEAAMGDEGGHATSSRLSTLLPLVRSTFMFLLFMVVFFVVLAELGVNVGPLIAGAGVIGIAIGFGAQTLVTDVISGIFFLIDDAFRRGEYIDVKVAKGTVEKISLRSLQLRHHNGPVNTVPFGQIATVTNYSRDWAIIKLEIRVPFETDIEKVRKLVKKIGQEMMADEALSKMMLEPLKSQGVVRVDDSALIMRCKFTAKPGEQFMVRREAFTRIQRRFAEEGIHFAPRRVIVDAPTPELAKAGTAAIAAEQETGGAAAPTSDR
jgi:small-conductance mechanosensitive channel